MSGTHDVSAIAPIEHAEAMAITEVENAKFARLLDAIGESDWHRPTPCDRWTVHEVAAHVIGAAAAQASPREFIRQVRAGRPVRKEIGLEFWWDGMNEVQVGERSTRTARELQTEWATVSSAAVRARTKLPRLLARLPLLNLPPPVGRQPISYLFDMGFTRDVWMHRIDIAEAVGHEPDLDGDHDGRILADIVAEWAATHLQPFEMHLEGPAGGTFVAGAGGDVITSTITNFARCLTGRSPADGLLAHPLPL
jgi:uncharacterized protein (TIGR03083 family)